MRKTLFRSNALFECVCAPGTVRDLAMDERSIGQREARRQTLNIGRENPYIAAVLGFGSVLDTNVLHSCLFAEK